MSILDIFGLLGFLISAYLAYLEIRRGKRQLSLFVEITELGDPWKDPTPLSKATSIRITNSGERPVTVVAISAFVDGGSFSGSSAPSSALDREGILPKTLLDGENIELKLEDDATALRNAICSPDQHAYIRVWDAEGNEYNKFGLILTSERLGSARVYKSADHYPYKTAGWRKRRIINFFPRVFEKPILFFYKTKYNLKKKFKRNN